jgi:hypothetical protein
MQSNSSASAAAAAASAPKEIRQPEVESLREPEYVAPMTVWLCTDNAWDVNGKIFHVNGGLVSLAQEETPLRTLSKNGIWTIDELAALAPTQLIRDLRNPAPPAPDLDIPGRPAPAQ